MSDSAIRVEHLSKLYHSGARQERHDTTSAPRSAGLPDVISDSVPRSSGHCGCRPETAPG